jgi:hypothetical protein
VSRPKSTLILSNAACLLACCVSMLAQADSAASSPTDAAAPAQASQTVPVDAQQQQPATPFVGDDPVAIRNVLAKQPIHATSLSLRERLRKLVRLPGRPAPHDSNLVKAGLDRELVFVIPVPYGVVYESKTHELTVDTDLSGEDRPGSILLGKSVKGASGRDLVVAAEARSKGYIQHIELIKLKTGKHSKTLIQGHFPVSQAAFAKTHGAFAIALRCGLVPPYLKDQREHTDPTDDEPTDITTRTSTLYADVHSVWLVSPQAGVVLTRKLQLSN